MELDQREHEFRAHVLIDAFDVPTEEHRRPSPQYPSSQPTTAEKRLYLHLRGWDLGPGRFQLHDPKMADCCRLTEAFQYQVQLDMMIVIRRFGYAPVTQWRQPFKKVPSLHRQFFGLLQEGRLAEQHHLELQALHLPDRGNMLSVWCHYCLRFHNHGEGAGDRVPHCDVGDPGMVRNYVLLEPNDMPQTLLDVYRPYQDEIRELRVRALEASRLPRATTH